MILLYIETCTIVTLKEMCHTCCEFHSGNALHIGSKIKVKHNTSCTFSAIT